MSDVQEFEDDLLLCCKGKRCPTVSKRPDGSLKLHEDGVELVLDSDQATLLKTFLEQKGY